ASSYRAGRGRDWLKVKCVQTRELAVVGYTDPEGSRQGFGSLVLGEAQDGRLVHVGRVGTGFSDRVLRSLTPRLKSLEVAQAAVNPTPRGAAARGVHWIRPELVADVAFTERTRDGILRHPVFRGLREDKIPKETAGEAKGTELEAASRGRASSRQKPRSSASGGPGTGHKKQAAQGRPRADSAAGRAAPQHVLPKSGGRVGLQGMRLTNPDKVLYPEDGITKRRLVDYYLEVQERIFPYLKDRPLTIRRCPDGYDRFCFWEKHLDDLPHGLRSISLDDPETEKKRGAYFYAASMEGVLALVQLGALELHVWGSRAARVEHPDLMIFDIDPDAGLPWKQVIEACTTMRERLDEIGLKSWLKTTGGKGLHVCVPLGRRQDWDEVKEFSRALAESVAARQPEKYTLNPLKARRKGKIFLDYLRNGRGATSVAAYSTRARPGAPVSMPLDWGELDLRLRPDAWTVENAGKRLRRPDPWSGFYACRQSITAAMRQSVGLSGARPRSTSAMAARSKSDMESRSKSDMESRSKGSDMESRSK
ncbi:MAG TPA: DNA ligase D, partial [Candidatus Polarisedimenticolia bacterium]|nr:DNA ligase D [Candidatus Polarisedimenticolia bacterium]